MGRIAGKAHIAYTPVISDGITNGSKPMRYSLVSRDYIADCLEIMHEGYVPACLHRCHCVRSCL